MIRGGELITKKRITPQGANHKICDVNKLQSSNPFVKETNPTDSAAQAASSADCCLSNSREEKLFVEDPLIEELMERGINYNTAVKLLIEEGPKAIEKSIIYVEDMVKKNKTKNSKIGNPAGYFMRTIENKYYLQEKES